MNRNEEQNDVEWNKKKKKQNKKINVCTLLMLRRCVVELKTGKHGKMVRYVLHVIQALLCGTSG